MPLWDRIKAAFSPAMAWRQAAIDAETKRMPNYLPVSGTGRWMGDLGGLGQHVREPFLGAWQKNLEGAGNIPVTAFSGVYACATIISQDVAKLPLRLLRIGDQRIPEPAPNHPISQLFERGPNPYQTMMDLLQIHMISKLLTGNGYIYKEQDDRGVVKNMHHIPARNVQVLVEPESKIVAYHIVQSETDRIMTPEINFDRTDPALIIPARFMLHDRINAIWHPLIGVPPLFAAAVAGEMGAAIQAHANAFFGNMARPSGFLSAPGVINDVTAERLKREWEQRYSQGNLGRTAVLGDGLSWEPIVMSAVDAQLIDQLRYTIEDIARVYRVPLYLLGDPSKSSARNSEQLARTYYQGCLQYHLESTERRFNQDLYLRGGHYCDFDLDALFRMETDMRYESYQKGIQSGVLSINEARFKEGLPPVKGGEVPRIQVQYQPIDQPNALAVPGVPTGDDPADDEDDDTTPPPDDDEDDDDDEERNVSPVNTEPVVIEKIRAGDKESRDVAATAAVMSLLGEQLRRTGKKTVRITQAVSHTTTKTTTVEIE